MATYAVGDIQGCIKPLKKLLKKVDFSPSKDTLWAAGDLINRGPDSLETLNFLMDLRGSLKVVLGNHDLHFLAVVLGNAEIRRKDTLSALLKAKKRNEIVDWLLAKPLLHHDSELGYTMVHAGIPPQWTISKSLEYAAEVQSVLKSKNNKAFFKNMYGNQPDKWSDSLKGMERLRLITNYFTRMRFCDSQGKLELETKTGPDSAPKGYKPWFSHKNHQIKNKKVLFGHWAALLGETNTPNFIGLDTGCVWGGKLTLLHLEKHEKIAINCDCDL